MSTTQPSQLWKTLLKEPLLHFIVLGGLIFAVDQWHASRQEDPRVITVGPAVDQQVTEIFRAAQGRTPTAAELKILRQRWVDNEILFREGLSLRLEQGDSALRERVIFKALNVIESNLRLPKVDDAALRVWFEQHRAQYDQPARFDFSEAVISSKPDESAARAFATALNTGAQADVQSGLRVFEGRPLPTIVDSFGADFAGALEQLGPGSWQVLPSSAGPRVVRLEARTEGARANFEELRASVRQDWQDQQAQTLRTAAVRELGKKYVVKLPGAQS